MWVYGKLFFALSLRTKFYIVADRARVEHDNPQLVGTTRRVFAHLGHWLNNSAS